MRFSTSILWNLFGAGLPLLVAVATIPTLIDALGTSRFGVLSLAWVVVGYFGLFDLGLGRALTQLISQRLGHGHGRDIPPLVWTAMTLMAVLGIAGGASVAALSPWLVGSQLAIPPELRAETLPSFFLLAASIPIVIVTTGLRGILEARQRFDVVNAVRGPLGVLNYLGPLAVLAHTNALPALVAALVGMRALSCLVYLAACLRLYPELRRPSAPNRVLLRQLLAFGGWMTLSNVAAPLLLYLGRLSLAVLVSAAAVAYFSTPYDVVINLLLIPGVFVSVLFPMFAQQFPQDRTIVSRLYGRSMRQLFVVMLPLALSAWWLAEPALAWWIGTDFARQSHRVAQWLAIGIFVNSFGHVSQALIQAYGRPDLTAKLHVAELIAYVPYMAWLIQRHGVEGAAVAWVVRVTVSTLALWWLASRCLSGAIHAKVHQE